MHELAKVDAHVGAEKEHQARPVEGQLGARQLHRKPMLADFQQRDPKDLFLALLLSQARDDVVVGCQSDDAVGRLGGRSSALLGLGERRHHGSHGQAVVGLHDDLFAGSRSPVLKRVLEHEGLCPSDLSQLDRHEACAIGHSHTSKEALDQSLKSRLTKISSSLIMSSCGASVPVKKRSI